MAADQDSRKQDRVVCPHLLLSGQPMGSNKDVNNNDDNHNHEGDWVSSPAMHCCAPVLCSCGINSNSPPFKTLSGRERVSMDNTNMLK